ncbi:MAG: tyrosine--tRNA ligase [Candidatus Omnitrophica bacterium]|nr:tyrosine--tRNA ligase [Candidatus Omnitrophota bacterium]MBU4140772.1 tyrosine--tRNA ligase [Candidatus Omnitrophota bacterium]
MAVLKDVDKQIQIIKRAAVEIISEEGLRKKIENSVKLNRPLIIKAGFDPSAPDIHLGHTVLLRKLRHFQQLGHRIIFLIGDFTAMIGDPSGRDEMRPRLTKTQVLANAKTYQKQVGKILDIKKVKIVFNSAWLAKLTTDEMAQLLSKYTVARVLERDDFLKRYKEGKDISMLEFFYPLLQAYDSVVLRADVELGGTDQKFNLLMGRTIQERYGQDSQTVITMPLLEGTDGVQKMSKSYANYIGINEPAGDMYGKIMSLPDKLIEKYYELLTDIDLTSIKDMHPMEAKKRLAKEIVCQYHREKKALEAQTNFEKIFQERDPFTGVEPRDIPVNLITTAEEGLLLSNLLCLPQALNLVKSKSEFRRLIGQGAVTVNAERITDLNYRLEPNKEYCIKVGKTRFSKIVLR